MKNKTEKLKEVRDIALRNWAKAHGSDEYKKADIAFELIIDVIGILILLD